MNLEKFRTAFFNDYLSSKLTKPIVLFKEITGYSFKIWVATL
jgi:hypothetical protein